MQLTGQESGTIRETFINSMLREVASISFTNMGDFLADDIIIEVGGKNKKENQIRKIQHAVLAKDDIEIGLGNEIPLWLFWFLY